MQKQVYSLGEISEVGPFVKIRFDQEPDEQMIERLKCHKFLPYMDPRVWIRKKDSIAFSVADLIMQEA